MKTHRPHGTRRWWEIGLAIAVVVITAAALIVRAVSTPQLTPGSPWIPPLATISSIAPPADSLPALAVKIDNVREARPATGLGSASVVYVEPVEGGLTRLVAVYLTTPPAVVGPVRSARRTDIELLAQYGTPVLAYSGAAPELLPTLHAANLVNASPAEAPSAFHRDNGRASPHNLYLRPLGLPSGATAPAEQVLQFGHTPVPGAARTHHDINFGAASFSVTWSPAVKRWLISMDGTPLTSTESGTLSAATVVEQRVVVSAAESTEDLQGRASPVARTVGQGTATILRDGQVFDVTWTRPAASNPTRFHTASGVPLPLAAGPVWVLLVPDRLV